MPAPAGLSQNGWPAYEQASMFTPFPWVTGRIRPGDAFTLLDYLARRFNDEVEPIVKAHSWGWAFRPIRGATRLSNHASGTAVDFNAPAHPLGKSGTFTPEQVAAINRILSDLKGAIRWGGSYSGRKDEMHFEIVASPAQAAQVARSLTHPDTSRPTPPGDDDMPLNDADKKWIAAEIRKGVAAAVLTDGRASVNLKASMQQTMGEMFMRNRKIHAEVAAISEAIRQLGTDGKVVDYARVRLAAEQALRDVFGGLAD